jgi:hypothetical protein
VGVLLEGSGLAQAGLAGWARLRGQDLPAQLQPLPPPPSSQREAAADGREQTPTPEEAAVREGRRRAVAVHAPAGAVGWLTVEVRGPSRVCVCVRMRVLRVCGCARGV